MKKGLKEFISYIERDYKVRLKHPDDFKLIYSKVGAVFYSAPCEEIAAIREFFKQAKYFEFTGFDSSRMIVRKLARASKGSGKNIMYLKSDYTFTKESNKAMYASNAKIQTIIKALRNKNSETYGKLKFDYTFM